MTPLRLLLTADPLLPVPPKLYGGIERVVADLVAGLAVRGHVVALLAHEASSAPVASRFAWPATEPVGLTAHAANLRALDRAVRDFDPHVIHSFSRLAYLGRSLVSRRPKLMCYQRAPTPRTVRAAAALGGRSLRFAGCSEFLSAAGRAAGGRWVAVHNCVDTARYAFVPAAAPEAPLVFLSRLEAIKGAHHAIAIARAAGRRLVLAGNRATQGEHARYFEREVAPFVDGRQVEYVGPVDDAQKDALLGRAAAMLLPLEWDEPFGIVMIEALACGTPVVAFRRGAAPEVIRDGIDGFVVEDVPQAVAAVARLGELDRSRCRGRAVDAFGIGPIVAAYERVYAELLGT